MPSNNSLPDITNDLQQVKTYELQWVGMENIAIPLTIYLNDSLQTITANTDIYVSLNDASAKGIHMSRLHGLLNKISQQNFDKNQLLNTLNLIVESQNGLSSNAKINLRFDVLLPKKSLLSDNIAYQSYAMEIIAQLINGVANFDLHLSIPYSSTCPCSAALARQLLVQAIDDKFSDPAINKADLLPWLEGNSIATPHNQRSYTYLKLSLNENYWPELSSLIMKIESVLETPVQAMVKRIDEQEFARLNAKNLMFCEDAARKLKKFLNDADYFKDYWFKVEHQESLHAHNAVVIDQKNWQ